MRIVHISDIHFFYFNKNPLQFFNKSFFGNLNYLFNRKKLYNQHLAYLVTDTFLELGVTHIIITGDYTCSSNKQEFRQMKRYVNFLIKKGFIVFTIPGNHDCYTRKTDDQKIFYKYLHRLINFSGDANFNLINDRVVAYNLQDNWWLVCVDCAHKTSIISSTGIFDLKTEENLNDLLSSLPKNASIIIANHFPYKPFKYPRCHLQRGESLKQIIQKNKNIRLFMHGHCHINNIENENQNLTISDSGSISLIKKSTFNLITLENDKCYVSAYLYNQTKWVAL